MISSDLARSLGCDDLTAGKKFTILLVSDINMLWYSAPNSRLPVPVKITTDGGFAVLINQLTMRLWSGCNIMQSTHRYGSSFNQECEKSGQ